jgi:hypothetical protein
MQLRLAPRVPWMMVVGADGAGSLVDAVASRATGRYASFRIVGWPRPEGSTPQRLREYWTRVVHLRAKGYVVALATTGAPPAGVPAPDLIFRLEPRPGPAVAAVTPPARHRRGSTPTPTEHLIDPSLAPDVQATLLEGAVRAWLVARTGPASPSPDAAASVVAAASHPDGAPSC